MPFCWSLYVATAFSYSNTKISVTVIERRCLFVFAQQFSTKEWNSKGAEWATSLYRERENLSISTPCARPGFPARKHNPLSESFQTLYFSRRNISVFFPALRFNLHAHRSEEDEWMILELKLITVCYHKFLLFIKGENRPRTKICLHSPICHPLLKKSVKPST